MYLHLRNLPEFTIKKQMQVGKYTIITLDPMGLKPKTTDLNVSFDLQKLFVWSLHPICSMYNRFTYTFETKSIDICRSIFHISGQIAMINLNDQGIRIKILYNHHPCGLTPTVGKKLRHMDSGHHTSRPQLPQLRTPRAVTTTGEHPGLPRIPTKLTNVILLMAEIRRKHQLRLVVYPIIYKVFIHPR